MNFLILVNPAKSYKSFFHGIGKAMSRQGHNIFYAVDSRRSIYVDPISEIDGGHATFFFDDYLKENISKKYPESYYFDCTWGEYYYSDFDRFLTQYFNLNRKSDYWKVVRCCLDEFFVKLIEEKNIDVVLYENVSNSFEYSAYRMARLKGAVYLGLMGARIPGRFEIQSSIIEDELKFIKELSAIPPTEKEHQWYERYRSNLIDIQPDYMKQNGLDNISLKKLLNKDNFIKAYRLFVSFFKVDGYYDYANGSPIRAIIKSIRIGLRRKHNAQIASRFYLSQKLLDKSVDTDMFFVYPIHYHPESSTSVLAPSYTNEFNNILNISNNLPFGYYLYVKDHTSAVGVQDKTFYKKVSSLPAVKLISPQVNIKELINKAQGVITVNSTAGYEALILGKPVYLLGRVFYEDFNNVTQLKNFSDISECIFQKKLADTDVAADVIAYYRHTFDGVLDFTHKQTATYYDDIVAKIMLKLERLDVK